MNRLRELRLILGWNMKRAAQEIGIPYTTYVGYEKGEREPNSETLIQLADFYGCSIDYLIGKDDSPTDDGELSDLLQLMRDRPELRALLDVGARTTPKQVQRLIDLMNSWEER